MAPPVCFSISATRASDCRLCALFACRESRNVLCGRWILRPQALESAFAPSMRPGTEHRDQLSDTLAHEKCLREAVGTFQSSCGRQSQQHKLPSYLVTSSQSDKRGQKLRLNSRTICVMESLVFEKRHVDSQYTPGRLLLEQGRIVEGLT